MHADTDPPFRIEAGEGRPGSMAGAAAERGRSGGAAIAETPAAPCRSAGPSFVVPVSERKGIRVEIGAKER